MTKPDLLTFVWSGTFTQLLWKDITSFISNSILSKFVRFYQNVLFGYTDFSEKDSLI